MYPFITLSLKLWLQTHYLNLNHQFLGAGHLEKEEDQEQGEVELDGPK